jgi:hypothetical protein
VIAQPVIIPEDFRGLARIPYRIDDDHAIIIDAEAPPTRIP